MLKSIIQCIQLYFYVNSVYGIGYNRYGTFGIGTKVGFSRYTKLSAISSLIFLLNNINIFQVDCGRLFIESHFGELYKCGRVIRDNGQQTLHKLHSMNSVVDTNNINVISDSFATSHTLL
eukprot:132081_1